MRATANQGFSSLVSATASNLKSLSLRDCSYMNIKTDFPHLEKVQFKLSELKKFNAPNVKKVLVNDTVLETSILLCNIFSYTNS